jgi:hypothetical protein
MMKLPTMPTTPAPPTQERQEGAQGGLETVTIPSGALAMRGYGPARVFAALSALGAGVRYAPIVVVELARAAGVHRNTVPTALRRLAAAGLAREKPGRPGYWRIYMTPLQPYSKRGESRALDGRQEGD